MSTAPFNFEAVRLICMHCYVIILIKDQTFFFCVINKWHTFVKYWGSIATSISLDFFYASICLDFMFLFVCILGEGVDVTRFLFWLVETIKRTCGVGLFCRPFN